MDRALIPHPDHPSPAAASVGVSIARGQGGLQLGFVVTGDLPRIVLPPPARPCRTEGLWRSTCFELFVRGEGEAYLEFNFSPSGQWAAYGFDAYRAGRREWGLAEPPLIRISQDPDAIRLAALVTPDLGPDPRIGLAAVIEDTSGTLSYWALAHPAGAPDFHHPSCFALELPPAPRP